MNREEFKIKCKEKGVILQEEQLNQLETYMRCLLEWNQKMNLTAITEEEEIWEKHFYDSIMPFQGVDFISLCDVGSGAGFPGIPVKIAFPDVKLTIVEPLQKRCRFLNEVISQLHLSNVNIVCARAEDFAKNHRESYDVVSARAVARLPILLELCVPLVRKDGYMIALKGKQAMEEFEEAKQAMDVLGIVCQKQDYLDVDEATRINFYFQKIRKTPSMYPRGYAQIKKRPIGG